MAFQPSTVNISVVARTAQATRALSQVATGVSRLGGPLARATGGFANLSASSISAAGAFGAFGVAAGGAVAGMTMLTAGTVKAVSSFASLEKKILEVQTLGANTRFESVFSGSQQLAETFGTTSVQQAQAFYDTISAGATSTAESMTVMNAANKLALGGVSDLNTTAQLLNRSLRAWGLEAREVTRLSDSLFAAMQVGVTTINELASRMPMIVSIASQTGVQFEEVAGALGALTRAGLQTDKAVVGLRGALTKILKPGAEALELADQLGIEFNSSALESKGMVRFFEEIIQKTGGYKEAIAKLFPDNRALAAVLALTGNNFRDLRVAMDAQANAAGRTEEAVATMSDSFTLQSQRVGSAAMSIAEQIGGAVVSFTGLTDVLRESADSMSEWADNMRSGDASVRADLIMDALMPMDEMLAWLQRKNRQFGQSVINEFKVAIFDAAKGKTDVQSSIVAALLGLEVKEQVKTEYGKLGEEAMDAFMASMGMPVLTKADLFKNLNAANTVQETVVESLLDGGQSRPGQMSDLEMGQNRLFAQLAIDSKKKDGRGGSNKKPPTPIQREFGSRAAFDMARQIDEMTANTGEFVSKLDGSVKTFESLLSQQQRYEESLRRQIDGLESAQANLKESQKAWAEMADERIEYWNKVEEGTRQFKIQLKLAHGQVQAARELMTAEERITAEREDQKALAAAERDFMIRRRRQQGDFGGANAFLSENERKIHAMQVELEMHDILMEREQDRYRRLIETTQLATDITSQFFSAFADGEVTAGEALNFVFGTFRSITQQMQQLAIANHQATMLRQQSEAHAKAANAAVGAGAAAAPALGPFAPILLPAIIGGVLAAIQAAISGSFAQGGMVTKSGPKSVMVEAHEGEIIVPTKQTLGGKESRVRSSGGGDSGGHTTVINVSQTLPTTASQFTRSMKGVDKKYNKMKTRRQTGALDRPKVGRKISSRS